MSEVKEGKNDESRIPFVIHLPLFIKDEAAGLGEIIKRATAAIGIPACAGCSRRAEALNRRVVVAGKRRG